MKVDSCFLDVIFAVDSDSEVPGTSRASLDIVLIEINFVTNVFGWGSIYGHGGAHH